MKINTFIGSVLGAAITMGLVSPALAADLGALRIKSSGNISNDCNAAGYDPVWSCFINEYEKKSGSESLVPTPTIYIRPDLPAVIAQYAFLQSVGHYVAMPYSDQELAEVFNPAPNQKGFQDVRRAAAMHFALWALGGQLPPAKVEFFHKALLR